MSSTLSPVDLSTFSVGQSGSLDLKPLYGGTSVTSTLPVIAGKGGTLRLHNDSGSGLLMALVQSGQQFFLPAGGWQDCYPAPGDTSIAFTVKYTLPNPPVTLLLATYYYPGEPVPALTILGNSPVGIGGSVNVTSVQTLSNDGNIAGTTIIEATASGSPASNVIIDNSGDIKIGAMISGNLFKVFQTIANPPAATTEVLLGTGQNNNIVESRDIIQADAGVQLTGGTIGLLSGSMSRVSKFSGSANSTPTFFNHGLGAVPDIVLIQFTSATSDTCVFAYDPNTMTNTQVKIVTENATPRTFVALAIKF